MLENRVSDASPHSKQSGESGWKPTPAVETFANFLRLEPMLRHAGTVTMTTRCLAPKASSSLDPEWVVY